MSIDPGVSWIDAEPDLWGGPIRELRRLVRRARMRPVRTLGIALLAALAVVTWRAHKGRRYPGRVTLRVTEDNIDPTVQPPLKRQLRQYVTDVVFSNARLAAVARAVEPGRHVDDVRADLEVEVYRNEFLGEREPDQPPRSTRIAIRYRSSDPARAVEMVRRLGQLVVTEESQVRAEQVAALARQFTQAADEAKAAVDACRIDIAKTELALAAPRLGREDRTRLQVELSELALREQSLLGRLAQANQHKAAVELRADLEAHRMGLRFEVVDLTPPARVTLLQRLQLVMIGLMAFAVLLPLAAIAVGALDDRVYDLDDVRRLGLDPAGHVPSFPGDEVGALNARADAARGIT